MRFRRLHPDPGEVEAGAQLAGLRLGDSAPAGRPYVVANFVTSADGRAAFGGEGSGPLGDDGDREVFHRLRTQVDAVLVGMGTLAAESYGRLARRPERREQRRADGLEEDPVLLLVSRSGSVAWDAPLFAEPAQRVLVFGDVAAPPEVAAPVEVVAGTEPGSALRAARERGIRSVLCEGGPTLVSALLHSGLVDELFLTLSPRLAGGGEEPTITRGPELPAPAAMELLWVLERDGFVFLRYGLK